VLDAWLGVLVVAVADPPGAPAGLPPAPFGPMTVIVPLRAGVVKEAASPSGNAVPMRRRRNEIGMSALRAVDLP
jgi:hypothetical protein